MSLKDGTDNKKGTEASHSTAAFDQERTCETGHSVPCEHGATPISAHEKSLVDLAVQKRAIAQYLLTIISSNGLLLIVLKLAILYGGRKVNP